MKGLGTGVHEKKVLRFLDAHVPWCWGRLWNRVHCKGNGLTVTLAVSLVSDRMKMWRFGHSQWRCWGEALPNSGAQQGGLGQSNSPAWQWEVVWTDSVCFHRIVFNWTLEHSFEHSFLNIFLVHVVVFIYSLTNIYKSSFLYCLVTWNFIPFHIIFLNCSHHVEYYLQ